MEVPKLDNEVEHTSVQRSVTGTLLRVDNRGVLIRGESGTGKSDLALELIARGHKLIADDAVDISVAGASLIGKAPSMLFGYLAVRDLGIVDIQQLYGTESVAATATVDVCVDLNAAGSKEEIDTPGTERIFVELFDVRIPLFEVRGVRNRPLAVIVETLVRLVNSDASDAEKHLIEKYNAGIAAPPIEML
jgi:HPr kinase/phosphorylase